MRSGILTVLMVCLGILPVSGMAQERLRPRTSFQGDFDPVVALTVVYGREPWNDLRALPRGTPGDGREFIEPLYDAGYVEGGVEKHVVIATLTPRPRSQYSCSACSPMLGGAVFRREGGIWRVESVGLRIEPGHARFDGRHGRLTLVRVGPDRFGLLHEVSDAGQGQESMRASLIFGVGGALASRLVVPVVQGPGPGACGVPAQHLKVGILEDESGTTSSVASARPASVPAFYEVVVDALWNEARCEPVAAGAGARSAGRACQRISRFHFRDGAYVQVGAAIDTCRPLPERTVDFRG